MRYVFLILSSVVFSSSGCLKGKDEAKQQVIAHASDSTQEVSRFNCSALKKTLNSAITINRKEDFDDINVQSLKRVDKVFYEDAGLEKVFNAPWSSIETYFYSFTNLAECSIVLLSVDQADDIRYQMYLINLDNDGRVKGNLLLFQYIPYPDGEEFTRSIFGSKSNDLLQITLKSSIGDYNRDTDKYSMIVDSVSSNYEVDKSGILTLVKKDSIRAIK